MSSHCKRKTTLLVHYSVPSLVTDDKKWQQIAENVINMDVAITVNPGKDSQTTSESPTSYQQCQTHQLCTDRLEQHARLDCSKLEYTISRLNDDPLPRLQYDSTSVSRKRAADWAAGYQQQKRRRTDSDAPLQLSELQQDYSTFVRTKGNLSHHPRISLVRSRPSSCEPCTTIETPGKLSSNIILIPFSGSSSHNLKTSNNYPFQGPFESSFQNQSSDFNISDSMLGFADDPSSHNRTSILCEEYLQRRPFSWISSPQSMHKNFCNRLFGQLDENLLDDLVCEDAKVGTSPAEQVHSNHQPTAKHLSKRGTERDIASLPLRVEPKIQFSAVNGCKITTTPPQLQRLAIKFHLWRRFRPEVLLRAVEPADRGYWRVMVRVKQCTTKRIFQQQSHTASQMSDFCFLLRREGNFTDTTSGVNKVDFNAVHCCMHEEDPGMWEEKGFLRFFRRLEDFVKKGCAGWATRIILKRDQVERNVGDIELRIYSFGQIVGHIWLALLYLSDGLLERHSLPWVSNGRVLLRMNGEQQLFGHVGL